MFDNWVDAFPAAPARRYVVPPRAVVVHLGEAMARDYRPTVAPLPLRVRAGGLNLIGDVPGTLHAWVRLASGTWLGLCAFTVRTVNECGELDVRQWVPASAIEPR